MSASIDPGQNSGPRSSELDGSKPKLAESIVIASELWLAVIVAHIVTVVATYGQTRDAYLDLAKRSYDVGSDEYTLITSSGVVVGILVVTTIIEIGVAVFLLVFTRKGYNWARFILGALTLYLVITAFLSLFGDVSPRWAMVPNIIGGVAALGAVVLLLRRDSDTYCKKMAQYRSAPRLPAAPPYPPAPGGYGPPPGYPAGQYPPNSYPPTSPYPPNSYPPTSPYPPVYPPQGQYPPYDERTPQSGGGPSGADSPGDPASHDSPHDDPHDKDKQL